MKPLVLILDDSLTIRMDLKEAFDSAGFSVSACATVAEAKKVIAEGKVKLIATDLFEEMSPHLQKGTITASIYQQPHRQGQIAVRLMADHLTNKTTFPPKLYLSPGVVMSSNFHLFREMRQADARVEGLPPVRRAAL